MLDLDQTVGLERLAGVHQVDDAIRQAHERRQLHRAVKLDDVGLDALGGEVALGGFDVLGGDAQARPALRVVARSQARGLGHHQPAARDPEVEQFVETVALVFHEHVLAGDAEVGGAEAHVGRHVGGADDHELEVRRVGVEDEFAARERVLDRLDAGALQQRQTLFQDTPLGERQSNRAVHDQAVPASARRAAMADEPGTRRMRAPSCASFSSIHS